jgi:DedD protein
MEQKKLLLVFVSVGVFLVIVLGAGILVFKPKTAPDVAAARAVPAPSAPASADPAEWVKNPQAVSGLQPPAPGSSTRGDVIIIYGERPGDPAASPTAAVSPDGSLKVDVAVPEAQGQTVAPPVPEPPKPVYEPAPVPPSPKAPPAVKKGKTAAPVKKTETAQKPASAPKPVGDTFWIQTGSFSAKARAESSKETLAAKGIASLIETKDISGKTYFRVRVGPYSTKNEADYWLALVKTIDGFDGSYITEIKAKR